MPVSKDGKVEILVEDGESTQAAYSPKGDRLLFISKRRAGHSQDQVYEKDLRTGAERRLTFQNGSTFRPQYHPRENWIIYSSSTDELKEDPPLLRASPEVSKLPFPYSEPLEIYLHSLKDFDIDRMTAHSSFDGFAQFNNDGNIVTFTRINGQRAEIVSFNRSMRAVHSVKNLGDNPAEYLSSNDGKTRAWLNWNEDFSKNRLRVQKGKEEARDLVAESENLSVDLDFSPDGKWLLWAQKNDKTSLYDLWAADLETLCPRRLLLNSEGERRYPTVSPDLKWLTFTLNYKNRSRIARMAFTPPAGTCAANP